MASVELRPGDTLNILWSSVQDTPLGQQQVESSFALSYDELVTRLKSKGQAGKSRRSGTEGARFSRVVALAVNAMRKGKWSTGADIDRNIVFAKLLKKFGELAPGEYKNITANARRSLNKLYKSTNVLTPKQKPELENMLILIKAL